MADVTGAAPASLGRPGQGISWEERRQRRGRPAGGGGRRQGAGGGPALSCAGPAAPRGAVRGVGTLPRVRLRERCRCCGWRSGGGGPAARCSAPRRDGGRCLARHSPALYCPDGAASVLSLSPFVRHSEKFLPAGLRALFTALQRGSRSLPALPNFPHSASKFPTAFSSEIPTLQNT